MFQHKLKQWDNTAQKDDFNLFIPACNDYDIARRSKAKDIRSFSSQSERAFDAKYSFRIYKLLISFHKVEPTVEAYYVPFITAFLQYTQVYYVIASLYRVWIVNPQKVLVSFWRKIMLLNEPTFWTHVNVVSVPHRKKMLHYGFARFDSPNINQTFRKLSWNKLKFRSRPPSFKGKEAV